MKKRPGTVVRIEEAQAFIRWRRWKTLYYAAYFALAWLIFYGMGTLILPAETQRASSWLLFVTGLALGGAWALGRWNERGLRRSRRSAPPREGGP
ncbi:MAG: hypothetical protein HYY85_08490 [Deltaproteobacteria bacterium]|nr:hypothetical protein [Deltaproteobacteria bacterium]